MEVALEYYEKKNYPINVLRLGENHGKGGAVKQGVERAKGDYILMVRFAIILALFMVIGRTYY